MKKGTEVCKWGRIMYVWETDISIYLLIYLLEPLFSMRAGLCSLRNMWQCLGMFGVATAGEGCCCPLVGGGRNAAGLYAGHYREWPDINVKTAEEENPVWSLGFKGIWWEKEELAGARSWRFFLAFRVQLHKQWSCVKQYLFPYQ